VLGGPAQNVARQWDGSSCRPPCAGRAPRLIGFRPLSVLTMELFNSGAPAPVGLLQQKISLHIRQSCSPIIQRPRWDFGAAQGIGASRNVRPTKKDGGNDVAND
jgi:hypothetical protein